MSGIALRQEALEAPQAAGPSKSGLNTGYFCSSIHFYLKAKGSKKRGRKVSFDAVRRMAVALPGVEEGTIHGCPAFRLQGKMLACEAVHKSAEPDTLVVSIPLDLRTELIESDPDSFYLTDHYVNYPMALVRLSSIDVAGLRVLLSASWRFLSAKKPISKLAVRRVSAKRG